METVLVIDSNPESLTFLCKLLGNKYPVLSARDGKRALSTAGKARPNAVVFNMEERCHENDWLMLKNTLLSFQELDIPVLLLTCRDQKEQIQQLEDIISRSHSENTSQTAARLIERENLFHELEVAISSFPDEDNVLALK